MDLLELCLNIATAAHEGQTDIGGQPYINHPVQVSRYCQSKKAKAAALLHDVLEDTALTKEDLKRQGVPADIIRVVELLTKEKAGSFNEKEYFRRIKEDPVACEVKKADLLHNLDLSRIQHPGNRDIKREIRYLREYRYLLGMDKDL